MKSAWCKGKFRTTNTMFQVNTFKSIPTKHYPLDSSFCLKVSGQKKKNGLRIFLGNGSHMPPTGQLCQCSQDGLHTVQRPVFLRHWPGIGLSVSEVLYQNVGDGKKPFCTPLHLKIPRVDKEGAEWKGRWWELPLVSRIVHLAMSQDVFGCQMAIGVPLASSGGKGLKCCLRCMDCPNNKELSLNPKYQQWQDWDTLI